MSLVSLVPAPRRLCFADLYLSVFLTVCLCLLATYMQTTDHIFMKILPENWLNFVSLEDVCFCVTKTENW